VEFPRGHAGNPMTDAEVEAKFRAMVEPRYGRTTADAVLGRCWKFEDVTDVTDVLTRLGDR
jgi:2-methylcitrate dehydratase